MKITKHFSLNEFKCKDGTPYPEKWISSRLKPLCDQLEILRSYFSSPVTITSGYRTVEHNKKIGGAKASQHVQGRAADFVVKDTLYPPGLVHEVALVLYDKGELKIGGLGKYEKFTHIDVRSSKRLVRWQGKGQKDMA